MARHHRRHDLLECSSFPDAVFEMGGRADSVGDYRRLCESEFPKLAATQHLLGLPLMETSDGGVRVTTPFTAYHIRSALAPGDLLAISGYCTDIFSRGRAGSVIARRRDLPLWSSGNGHVLGGMGVPVQ